MFKGPALTRQTSWFAAGGGDMRIPTICIGIAKQQLSGTEIKVASVATAFPSGQSTLQVKLDETRFAVGEGADEVDMVISRGEFLRGNYHYVYDEIQTIKEACGAAHLKVILETGELSTLDNVRLASDIAMHAGADFIKTSTGKIQPAATLTGDSGYAGGHSGFLPCHRKKDRYETSRRHQQCQISPSIFGSFERNAGRGLAH